MEVILKNLKDTQKLAQKLAKEIVRNGGPSVVALYGDLGAGKTTFTQFLAEALGNKEKILSPTFVIMKTFALSKPIGDIKYLTHIDTYRLKSARELLDLGLEKSLNDPENITIIEWPEKIEAYLPANTIKIKFEVLGSTERHISIQ